jgi:phosphoglycolate phosphatase
MYQLIIFDWDGTLMDSAQKIANCIIASAHDADLPPPSDHDAKSIIGLGLFEAMRQLFPGAREAQIVKVVEAYKYHFVKGDVTEQGYFSGVEKGLAKLEEQGVFLAVATGKSRAGLDRVFGEGDLHQHFVVSRCADETRSKPHPQMLHEILEFTSIAPHKAIMVGDTTYDMDMACNAGVAGLGAGYGVHTELQLRSSKAIDVKHSFADLLDWLLDGRVEKAHA